MIINDLWRKLPIGINSYVTIQAYLIYKFVFVGMINSPKNSSSLQTQISVIGQTRDLPLHICYYIIS